VLVGVILAAGCDEMPCKFYEQHWPEIQQVDTKTIRKLEEEITRGYKDVTSVFYYSIDLQIED